jgi:hypothetical protein
VSLSIASKDFPAMPPGSENRYSRMKVLSREDIQVLDA